jgi:hypothetical protein
VKEAGETRVEEKPLISKYSLALQSGMCVLGRNTGQTHVAPLARILG